MDYIRAFEVELDKTVYYAGETVSGHVYLEVEDNMRMQSEYCTLDLFFFFFF